MTRSRPAFRATRLAGASVAASFLLAACGAPVAESPEDWITRQRAQMRAAVPPIADLRTFTPQPYTAAAAPDPFSSQKLTLALHRDAALDARADLVLPEQARPRQALEAFPLDTMTLVGSLVRQGQPVALVRANQVVHAVRVGAYLGQNYGKVVRITDNQLILREIVQDTSGQWTERTVSLQLRVASP